MPLYRANAIVLRRIPLGETDKILTVLTRERGKYAVVAKGARKTTSRLAGATEPLMLLKAAFADGMNLDVLTQCEITESFPAIRGDFGLYLRATYACELMDRVTEERDPSAEAFDLLTTTLRILEHAADPDAALHAYELKLLTQTGYEPRLDSCARCEMEFAHATRDGDGVPALGFSVARGGAVCGPCADLVREEIIPICPDTAEWMLRLSYEGDARRVASLTLPAQVSEEIARVLRAHLKFRLERAVRSTAFLDAYRLGAMEGLSATKE